MVVRFEIVLVEFSSVALPAKKTSYLITEPKLIMIDTSCVSDRLDIGGVYSSSSVKESKINSIELC
jgi:hypothetical protein